MKILSSFAVLNIDGSDRVSFTYDVVNENTGDPESRNNKGNFYVVDETLKEHIEAIRDYIKQNRLNE